MSNIGETYTKNYHCWLFFEMIFNDFVEYDGWFDDAWHVMIFFLNLYDDAYMDAWMHG